MDKETAKEPKPTCFVVMGFGKKTDFETGRVLDLDKSYKNMIKPAVEAAGLKCIRADEIVHSGLIDVPMYEQLLNADVVVADLSTSNKNALYELGVRHALRPYTTVIIAEDGIKVFPFDLSHVVVRQYHHLGEDIGFSDAKEFGEKLTNAIKEIISQEPRSPDSPVYSTLHELTPPVFEAIQSKIKKAVDEAKDHSKSPAPGLPVQSETHSFLMQQVDEAQDNGNWTKAKELLTVVRKMMQDEKKKKKEKALIEMIDEQEDPYLLQRLALLTYKSKSPNEKEALEEACKILWLLNPDTSNDTETLGLWGATHKRLWELDKKETTHLDVAIRAYERGFYIKNDYYNGINYAFLLNVRAKQSVDRAEAISDFVEAGKVRKEVLAICEKWLKDNPMPAGEISDRILADYLKSWYWVKATIGEAHVGLANEDAAQKALNEAYDKAPEEWMKKSTEEQLMKLKPLLDNSPLRFINNEVS